MLEGKLVNLRPLEITDLERATKWINDPEVTHFLGARYPMSSAAEEVWLTERAKKQISFENVFFAIETKDGTHIGNTGLHRASAEDRKAELGIMIGEKDHWSKGFGGDAIVTLLGFGFREMNLHRVFLTCYDFNERGQACYRKCGFIEEGRLREDRWKAGAYRDTIVMGILRGEYDRRHGG